MGLLIVDREIIPEKSKILYSDSFCAGWEENWDITGGEWTAENGILTGLYRGNAGGIIYLKRPFVGDVMLDFYGTIIPPCTNDMNCTWRSKGWNNEINDSDTAYIAGINGWWHGYTGIERYPECSPRVLSAAFKAEPGKEYHVNAGIVGNMSFVAIEGVVISILSENNPIYDPDCNKVGLGTYCSHIAFRNFKVLKPFCMDAETDYIPEF
ncbi:MAG: hypothetical protein GX633_04515 [Clostridiales bacterium]|nr:hypothetical protein [Clostridiales bacterium]